MSCGPETTRHFRKDLISHTRLKLLRFCRPSIIYWSLMWSRPVNSPRWKQFCSPFITVTTGVWRWRLRPRTACVCVCAVKCSLQAGFPCWRSLLCFSFVLVLLLLLKRPPYWICSLAGLWYIKCLTFSAPPQLEKTSTYWCILSADWQCVHANWDGLKKQ